MRGYVRSCRFMRPVRFICLTVLVAEAVTFSAWSYKMTATARGVEAPVEFAQVKVPKLPRHHKDKTVTRVLIEGDIDELELRARIDLLWEQVTALESRILTNTSRRVNA